MDRGAGGGALPKPPLQVCSRGRVQRCAQLPKTAELQGCSPWLPIRNTAPPACMACRHRQHDAHHLAHRAGDLGGGAPLLHHCQRGQRDHGARGPGPGRDCAGLAAADGARLRPHTGGQQQRCDVLCLAGHPGPARRKGARPAGSGGGACLLAWCEVINERAAYRGTVCKPESSSRKAAAPHSTSCSARYALPCCAAPPSGLDTHPGHAAPHPAHRGAHGARQGNHCLRAAGGGVHRTLRCACLPRWGVQLAWLRLGACLCLGCSLPAPLLLAACQGQQRTWPPSAWRVQGHRCALRVPAASGPLNPSAHTSRPSCRWHAAHPDAAPPQEPLCADHHLRAQ